MNIFYYVKNNYIDITEKVKKTGKKLSKQDLIDMLFLERNI